MQNILELKNITKIFDTLIANDNVSLDLHKGEILCLAGENGAGKTTLMRILYGLRQADSGEIYIQGKKVSIHSPLDANRLGIGMTHQYFMLFPELTVAQNVVMGMEPVKGGILYDFKKAEKEVDEVIKAHHFSIEADTLVKDLTVGQMQQVEIVKMLYRKADILILDEPTAVLTDQEIESLFKTLKALKEKGASLILITHKLGEIKQIADRVALMRQGKMIAIHDNKDLDEYEISRLMVGKEVHLNEERKKGIRGNEVITFTDISVMRKQQERPLLHKVNFTAYSGETLAFAGVGGNGLDVLEAVLGGLQPVTEGSIYRAFEPPPSLPQRGRSTITQYNAEKLRKEGLAYVPADRLELGSAGGASVWENMIINKRKDFSQKGLLNKKAIDAWVNNLFTRFSIAGNPSQMMGSLSGGNMQKVILAREIDNYKDYIVFSEPTWGLDVASSLYVYHQMRDLKEKGAAVILISSNLDEILANADRIMVMYRGTIVAELENNETVNKEMIGEYMLGLRSNNE
ncbi:MAG: ABC transporter ATP-binding protein [Spirochaetaceae bacterium]|jgi:simple sugar transport system ATP-binding protein|nr:ABC transporter ATP-binding protein [Spirochaetaceae bacterium]